jgi:hypothetical protein
VSVFLLLLALCVPVSASGGTTTGIAKHYAPGVFARVAHNREMVMRTDVAGYAAVPNCGYLGTVIQARVNGGKWERYQVLDCSAPKDRARHIKSGLILEVDYASAKRNGFVSRGRAPATVVYGR